MGTNESLRILYGQGGLDKMAPDELVKVKNAKSNIGTRTKHGQLPQCIDNGLLRFGCKLLEVLLKGWLRGRDLNPRPLGYESYVCFWLVLVLPCCSVP